MIVKNTTGLLSVKKDSKGEVLTEAQRKKCQHELSNWIKKHSKTMLEKGPETIDVNITGNMIILTITNYLTKYEKFILGTESSSDTSIKESRMKADLAVIRNGELNRHIEEYLNVKVLGHMFDALIEDDFSLWIVFLDTYLTT